jgi:hypothetical protein
MSVIQTVLVYVAIPLGIILLIALAVFGKSMARQPNRYRPGKPWTYPPSWYVPHPDAVVQGGSAHPQLEGAGSSTTAVGGASGEW